ncbi:uncharacterized protein AB675_5021 [Cyphellophora attinorum]|uniref:DUF7580 domain-containing protein n=1 Tax=Cyphellophora attinorum TaxID=1664694 RepID=A0A0N1NYX0_9EURO|nr:uncharacterized protein AB675_5021 [Phialophora attinorum]KPI39296.1 hypothetical protein AB675_5021 [Phialophora attinorum]
MAFFRGAAAGQGPFQRLTKLYYDTKQTYESAMTSMNAKEALESAPTGNTGPDFESDENIRELKRDFQVQQDRLLAWGINWSESGEDTSSFRQGGEKGAMMEKDIDRQIEKADLGEVVASIMNQIKGLLDQSGKLMHPERYESVARNRGEVAPNAEWNAHEVQTSRALLEQLTTCIDLLYSLSEGRQSESAGGKEKERESKRQKSRGLEDDIEEAYYGARREQSPKGMESTGHLGGQWEHALYVEYAHIDFDNGVVHRELDPPPYDIDSSIQAESQARRVGVLRDSNKPVLVDFVTKDVPPYVIGASDDVYEMHELGEKLTKQRKSLSWCGHLRLLGFTVSPKGPNRTSKPTGSPNAGAAVTASAQQESHQPNLEDRFKLAYNLIVSVLGYFANGDSHRHINSGNVLLIGKEATHQAKAKIDIRCPFIVQPCQDLVGKAKSDEPLSSTIYRHPSHNVQNTDSIVPAHDLYSLGLMLLEIGLWKPLTMLWKPKYDRRIFMERVQRIYSSKLASKCGSKYMRLVQRCLHAPAELLEREQPEQAGALLLEVAKEMRLCCALDEEGMPPISDLETFELLIIEQMVKTDDAQTAQGRGTSDVPPVPLADRQYSGTTKASSDAVRRKPIPLPSVSVPAEVKPERKKKRSTSHSLKKWPELPIDQEDLNQWNNLLMPRLRKILEDALNESPESCSVSLMKIGASPETAKTTVCIQCQHADRVHEVLRKRCRLKKGWGMIILKGDVHRSGCKPRRSGGRKKAPRKPKEQKFQPKPSCGASIGAFRDSEHLPPCSFGGTILVDGEPFGMTVHHMLDAPSDSEDEEEEYSSEEEESKPRRSAGRQVSRAEMNATLTSVPRLPHMESSTQLASDSELDLSPDEDEDDDILSDTESEASTIRPDYAITDDSGTDHWFLDDSSDTTTPSLIDDDFSDEEDDDIDDNASIGDKPAVTPYSLESEELCVTQPAIDDVDEDFFPDEDDRDEDHLLSHTFGKVHASSGIRRVVRGALKHEVDWALIRIDDERLDVGNLISASFSASNSPKKPGQPCKVPGSVEASAAAKQARENLPMLTSITPANKMSALPVACHARSSGYTNGRISQAMCLVKLHGRHSFSYSWCVDSTPRRPTVPSSALTRGGNGNPQRSIAALPSTATMHNKPNQSQPPTSSSNTSASVSGGILGIPGDSGAWIYNPNTGELAGHVLAYGERMKQAYIAPMEVLFEDIKARLGAAQVGLPGGGGVGVAADGADENALAARTAVAGVSGLTEGLKRIEINRESMGSVSTSTEGKGQQDVVVTVAGKRRDQNEVGILSVAQGVAMGARIS